MSKKILSIIIIVVILVLGTATYFYWPALSKIWSSGSSSGPAGVILFYGNGCPHCAIVDEFVKSNNVDQKVEFTKLEVFDSADNQKILLERVNACGIDKNSIGVPFLYDGKNCLMGDTDIINFFKEKAGIN